MSPKKIKIIYIAGQGRSGSTLLGRMLGQIPGVFMAGEVLQFLRPRFDPERICECGKETSHCDIWGPLLPLRLNEEGQPAFGNLLAGDVRGLFRLPRLMRAVSRRERLETEMERRLTAVYQGLSEEADCPVIVDTSKTPIYASLLARNPSLDLRIVHLVRDSRGVAYSWNKRQPLKAYAKRTVYMRRFHPLESALRWNLNLFLYKWYQRKGFPYLRVHYEAMVADPRGILERILAFAEHPKAPLDFIEGNAVHLEKGHTIAGNSNRFSHGWITLKRDETWRSQLSLASRVMVTALTFPGLFRYGYILSRQDPFET